MPRMPMDALDAGMLLSPARTLFIHSLFLLWGYRKHNNSHIMDNVDLNGQLIVNNLK